MEQCELGLCTRQREVTDISGLRPGGAVDSQLSQASSNLRFINPLYRAGVLAHHLLDPFRAHELSGARDVLTDMLQQRERVELDLELPGPIDQGCMIVGQEIPQIWIDDARSMLASGQWQR